jgi:hypothetical protein
MAAIDEPLIQVIDVPRYPLDRSGGGLGLNYLIKGCFLGMFIIVIWVLLKQYLEEA